MLAVLQSQHVTDVISVSFYVVSCNKKKTDGFTIQFLLLAMSSFFNYLQRL